MEINGVNYIVLKEAAAIMGLHVDHVRRLAREDKLPGAVKLGHNWLVPKESALDYVPGPQGFAAHPRVRV